jgi:hypothetical protein
MPRYSFAASLIGVFFLSSAANAQAIPRPMNSLSIAGPVSDTDTIPICQDTSGCPSGTPLKRATILQFKGVPFTVTDDKTTVIPAVDTYVIGGFSRSGITAQQISNYVFVAPDIHVPITYDAVRGVADLVSGTAIDLVNGIAGYVIMNAPSSMTPSAFPDAVAQIGFAVSASDGGRVWGNNVAVTDNQGQAISSGVGRTITAYEGDSNFTSTGTTGFGIIVQGASLVNPGFAIAIQCGPLDLAGFLTPPTKSQWSECLGTNDYATGVGLSIGRQGTGPGPSQISQLLQIGYTTDAGVQQNVNFYAVGVPVQGGGLVFHNTEGTLVNLNGAAYISPDYADTAQYAFTTGLDLSISSTNSPSRVTSFQFTDSGAGRQAIFMKALGGDLPILTITSTLPNTIVNAGTFNASEGFSVGSSAGATCSGAPSSSFASFAGIVIHC